MGMTWFTRFFCISRPDGGTFTAHMHPTGQSPRPESARRRFGHSVSLSGNDLAIGALSEASAATGVDGDQLDNSIPGSGAVYLFTRSGDNWRQQAYLKSSNAGLADSFGAAVSLSGSSLAVGAAFESSRATGVDGDQLDNSAGGSGAVYVRLLAP